MIPTRTESEDVMPTYAKVVIFGFGLAAAALGITQLGRGNSADAGARSDPKSDNTNSVKVLGIELRVSSTPLALIVVGLAAMLAPWLIPIGRTSDRIAASESPTGNSTPTVTTAALSPATTTALPAGLVRIDIQAEDAHLTSPMTARSDRTARGGAYILSTALNDGTARFDFDIDTEGTYEIWARVQTGD